MPNFWTTDLRRDFHQAVNRLHRVERSPSGEKHYRHSLPQGDGASPYTLRLRDELQMADHIAFLAQSQEGVESISAVCVEESANGLVFRLASNHTPSVSTIAGLRKFLNTLRDGAVIGTSTVWRAETSLAGDTGTDSVQNILRLIFAISFLRTC
jgi:hypothetical protein